MGACQSCCCHRQKHSTPVADCLHNSAQVSELGVPTSSAGFDVAAQLASASTVHTWQTQGLPHDTMSVENAIIISRCHRWPLLVDPQAGTLSSLRGFWPS